MQCRAIVTSFVSLSVAAAQSVSPALKRASGGRQWRVSRCVCATGAGETVFSGRRDQRAHRPAAAGTHTTHTHHTHTHTHTQTHISIHTDTAWETLMCVCVCSGFAGVHVGYGSERVSSHHAAGAYAWRSSACQRGEDECVQSLHHLHAAGAVGHRHH